MERISAARGNPRYGRALYGSRCAGCHGLHGEGGAGGAALNTPAFLAVASDEFLRDSIVYGRANTAMPSWKQLEADQVSDLLAYIRTWQPKAPDRRAVLDRSLTVAARIGESDEGAEGNGEAVYQSRCAACHGSNGEGALGPSLNSDAFLSIVDDEYLYTAIVEGRPGTAMPSWTHLAANEVAGLIHRRELEPFVARGDWDRGRIIYQGACSACHGANAEGGTGAQLNNPVFLGSASDAMLREWISYGKTAPAMGAFLRGSHGVVELTESQVEDVITYLRRFETEPRVVVARTGTGIAALGAEVYAEACAACHGPDEEEAAESDLTNPDFLRVASDGYLEATIVLERDMPKLGLTAEEISNVVAFIRSWEHEPPVVGIPARYVIDADIEAGEEFYAGHCAGCHGVEGKGGWASELNNREFLAAATDGFLQATIVLGRSNTAMRAFGIGAGGLAELSSEDINNIVAYVRTWAGPENRPE
jgi:cytochrome c oxidase cbb3-type subunit 3